MNSKSKLVSKFIIVVLVLSVLMQTALADTLPYVTYNFDYWEDIVYTPAAYVPDGTISAKSLGLDGSLGAIYDIYVDQESRYIYLCDYTFNRVVVVNGKDYSLVTVIDEFYNSETGQMDTLSNPQGLYFSESGYLYICDTGNQRLLYLKRDGDEFNYEGHLESAMLQSDILEEGYTFKPLKVCVDSAERIYIINFNEFQGILQLERDGTFNGYFGTINVNISLWNKIWRTISTQAQRDKGTMFIPTEYTGIDIDDSGFLYATYLDTTGTQAVMRLNSKGGDVIRKGANQNVGGDITGNTMAVNLYCGHNRMQDVVYCGDGMYSLLDNLRGRIFTYDAEGNLLYIYGGLGVQDGTFSSPRSIETNGNQRLVCDINREEVYIFSPTQYGTLINEAVACRYDGDESQAVEKWSEVLVLNENFEQAYIGIGKAYLNSGDYDTAMDYLSLGMSRSYYSIAYKRYRNNLLKENFNLIFGGVLVLIVAFLGFKLYKAIKNRNYDD